MSTLPLSPYEQWMVRSNLRTIRETRVTVAEQVALLRANGYYRVAEAVEQESIKRAIDALPDVEAART